MTVKHRSNPSDWHARWIWCAGEERPKNFYLYVRRSLVVPEHVRHADIRVTADSRYQLFVNGVRVARGPARCDRRWQSIDTWEITRHLVSGENLIAALVHHYGEWTFSYMLGRGGFLAEVRIESRGGHIMTVGTDSSWKVKAARTWERNLPRMSIQLGFPEVYDAREEIGDWHHLGYDDTEWDYATVLGPPGMEPWPNFLPREIPAMREQNIMPRRLIEFGEVGAVSTGHYVDLLRAVWNTSNGVAYLVTHIWSPGEGPFDLHAGSQDAIKLWFNDTLLINHLVERDPGPDQEVVPVQLRPGWNKVLAKIVQGEGQWHFYFRLEGAGRESLVYSDYPNDATVDSPTPWRIVGPFPCTNVKEGFDTAFPPEHQQHIDARYHGKGGVEMTWISAGVTRESLLPSIVMSREQRLSGITGALSNRDGLVTRGEPALIHPGAEHGCYAVIDFGKEVSGYPMIEISGASGGEIIDMGYGEALQTTGGDLLSPTSDTPGILNPDRSGVHYADRYICKSGKQRFETFDKRAFRYLQLDFRNVKQTIAVGPVSLNFSTYPVSYRGAFSCSDPLLDRIWETGRWTVQLSMEDAFSDSPWRERAQWWGDVRLEALVNYYCFGDTRLVRRGLRHIAQSQNAEGLTMAVYPTEWSGGLLPTYTLLWVISLWDYFEYSGDVALVQELLPAVNRAMSYFNRFRNAHDLLESLPHWLFVDWTGVETGGESASVNALYHGALKAAAKLAAAGGLSEQEKEYSTIARRVRLAMHTCLWDPTGNVFRDARIAGTLTGKISEQANCWAIDFGVADNNMAEQMIIAVFTMRRATVRSATPYFSFYVLCALAHTGRHQEALEYIRHHWKKMLDWGATTWWETWEPKASLCHGWSSGPTLFLQAEILGVKPGSPGWEDIHIRPCTGDLTWARGKVPTPIGEVSVEWVRGEEFSLVVTVPSRTRVSLPLMQNGAVSIQSDTPTTRAPERVEDHPEYATFTIYESGTYRFRSS